MKEASTKLEDAQTRINEHQNKNQEKTDALKAARTLKAQRTSINTRLTKLNNALSAAVGYEKAQSTAASERNLGAYDIHP